MIRVGANLEAQVALCNTQGSGISYGQDYLC
ncbi:hypothetical protein HCH_00914 [Hahella chejuensis KCTC 2396]|uniref:Uncharacterized protein n=1 Tax=Hahella chejuensis (strain KCTC 2396) TaxID=349521 RepID=Q2SNH0_HAHCH|nr:hypothetical protein HCH_00914 [Hahella chejuensis KCTC 2396]